MGVDLACVFSQTPYRGILFTLPSLFSGVCKELNTLMWICLCYEWHVRVSSSRVEREREREKEREG